MSKNVSPEEVEALVGEADSTAQHKGVELRDFRQPRRLSQSQQQAIRSAVEGCLPGIKSELSSWLPKAPKLTMSGIGEASAIGLFDTQEDPIAILTVDVAGAQGWVAWENEAALRTVMTILGAEIPEELVTRNLSPIEAGLVFDVLEVFTRQLGALLGLRIQAKAFSQDSQEFLGHYDAAVRTDPQRLFLHVDLDGPKEPSTLRFYLPGVLPQAKSKSDKPAVALPAHLDNVPIPLTAELGVAEVHLADLVKIEVGDVIPLKRTVGSPVDILIEGEKAGTAHWGKLNGSTALSIRTMDSASKKSSKSE